MMVVVDWCVGGHRKIDVAAAKKTPSKEDLRQLGGDAEEGGAARWEALRRRGSEAAVGRCAVSLLSCRGVAAVVGLFVGSASSCRRFAPWHATTWHAATSGCSATHLAKPLWLLLLLLCCFPEQKRALIEDN
jgi:hypothetical protein